MSDRSLVHQIERLTAERDASDNLLRAVGAELAQARTDLAAQADVHTQIQMELSDKLDKARTDLAAARAALGFFASVIKSGEPWTETCEQAYRAALGGHGDG